MKDIDNGFSVREFIKMRNCYPSLVKKVKRSIEDVNKTPCKSMNYKVFLWYLQESNQGHKDFQSFALPTELRYPLKGYKYKILFIPPKGFTLKIFV